MPDMQYLARLREIESLLVVDLASEALTPDARLTAEQHLAGLRAELSALTAEIPPEKPKASGK